MYKGLSILLLFVLVITYSGQAQQPGDGGQSTKQPKARTKAGQASAKKKPAEPAAETALAEPSPSPETAGTEPDRTKFDKAVAAPANADKARLLRAFLDEFPESELRPEAFTYLVTARAIVGEEKLKAGDAADGIASFKLAVEEAPDPVPDRLYNDIILKIPLNLFYGGQRASAMEIAQLIEKKVASNPKQLLSVAAFYLGIENAAEAKRVAEAAIASDPKAAAGYQALGLAHRLNFDLEEAAKAYAKAIEVEPSSAPAQRSLADMKRALGKPDEAAAIYRSLVIANENDTAARNGLVLSLFDGGKQGEAETELARAVDRDPKNFLLLAGAAYWYAANKQGPKAIEYAQKAIDAEPRYIWSHIALARGLMAQNKPVEAERALIKAKQFGNFPTLEYELASARFMAGLYREAVEELAKSFVLKDGMVHTKLGGRLERSDKTFTELIAGERKASILQPVAADDVHVAAKLKLLMEIRGKVEDPAAETEVAALADEFVRGDDKMKLHRQLYLAGLLLQKNLALPKAAELIKAAVGNSEAGLEVSAPAAAVMANELYESRTVAFARNEVVLIPDVPRQTLSAILRGRIEDLAGQAFLQQKNYPEAVVRLKRAVSVLPDKSAWWRASMWRLGTALEADGKDAEALDSYIQSYKIDRPSPVRYGVIEAVYQRVNGNTEGLEEKAGPKPVSDATAVAVAAQTPNTSKPVPATPAVDPAATEKTERTAVADLPKSEKQAPGRAIPRGVPAASFNDAKADASNVKRIEIPKIEPTAVEERAIVKEEKAGLKEEKAATVTDEVIPAKTAATVKTNAVETAETETGRSTKVTNDLAVEKAPAAVPAADDATEKQAAVKSADSKELLTEKAAVELSPKPDETIKTVEKTPESAAVAPPSIEPKTISEAPAEKKEAATPTVTSPAVPEKEIKAEPLPETPKTEPPLKEQPAEEKPKEPVDVPPPDPKKTEPEPSGVTKEPEPDREKVTEKTSTSSTAPAEPPAGERSADKSEQAEPEPPVSTIPKTSEKRPLVIVEDRLKPPGVPVKAPQKSSENKALFEPIIIKVPSTWVPKNEPEQPAAAAGQDEPSADARPGGKKKGAVAAESGAVRSRLIDGKEIVVDRACSLELSDDSISILTGGGSQSVLATVTGDGNTEEIAALASSQRDIEVKAEPDISGTAGRRFYVIKSISPRPGIYKVNFESPCGRRELTVRAR